MAKAPKLERIEPISDELTGMSKDQLLLSGHTDAPQELFRRAFNKLVKKSQA